MYIFAARTYLSLGLFLSIIWLWLNFVFELVFEFYLSFESEFETREAFNF